jgi:hypothetical protein
MEQDWVFEVSQKRQYIENGLFISIWIGLTVASLFTGNNAGAIAGLAAISAMMLIAVINMMTREKE